MDKQEMIEKLERAINYFNVAMKPVTVGDAIRKQDRLDDLKEILETLKFNTIVVP